MIKISSNKSFDNIKLDLFQVYESYYEDIDYIINNIYKTKKYYNKPLDSIKQKDT